MFKKLLKWIGFSESKDNKVTKLRVRQVYLGKGISPLYEYSFKGRDYWFDTVEDCLIRSKVVEKVMQQ